MCRNAELKACVIRAHIGPASGQHRAGQCLCHQQMQSVAVCPMGQPALGLCCPQPEQPSPAHPGSARCPPHIGVISAGQQQAFLPLVWGVFVYKAQKLFLFPTGW